MTLTPTGTSSLDAAMLAVGASTEREQALFLAGARYAYRTMAMLTALWNPEVRALADRPLAADPEFREAIAVLAELFREGTEA